MFWCIDLWNGAEIKQFRYDPNYSGDIYRESDINECFEMGNCFETKGDAVRMRQAIFDLFENGLP